MKRTVILIIAAVVAAVLLSGCASSDKTGVLAETDIPYAEAMVDNMLLGIAERDYEVFSRDFGTAMKAAMDEKAMDSLADLLESKIGEYQSRSFSEAAKGTQNGAEYTAVVYTATYSDEPGNVLISVTFGGEPGEETIEGLYFNSPKLREQ